MFYHLGKLATRYRWLIVGFWMVAIAVALPFAPQANSILHSGGFVTPDIESERAVTLLAQKLHLDLTVVQVIFTSQLYTADSPQFIQESQQALARVRTMPEVSGVISFVDNPRQISLDRRAAYVNVLLKPDPDSAPKLLPELERRLQPVPDLHTSIGGGPVFYEDIQSVSESDLRRAEMLAFPFAIIALLLVFRSVVAAMLPALVGGGAVIVSLAILGTPVKYFPVRLPRCRKRSTEQATARGAAPAPAGVHSGFWYRLSHLVMRHPVRVLVPVLLLMISLGLPFLGVRFSAPDASILPSTVPSRAA